jgi:hypothetical protein
VCNPIYIMSLKFAIGNPCLAALAPGTVSWATIAPGSRSDNFGWPVSTLGCRGSKWVRGWSRTARYFRQFAELSLMSIHDAYCNYLLGRGGKGGAAVDGRS